MKKLNSYVFTVILFFTIIIISAGCKSTPADMIVNPIDLLDNDNDIYIVYPKHVDSELLSFFLEKYIDGLNKKDISQLEERIDILYAGIKNGQRKNDIQAVISGKFPASYLNSYLGKSKGFSKSVYITKNELKYKVFDYSGLSLSIPSSKFIFAGTGVSDLIMRYDEINSGTFDENISLIPEIHDYLSDINDTIKFSCSVNSSFSFLGLNKMNLKDSFILGEFFPDSLNEKNYVINIDLLCNSDKIVKGIKSILSLMFSFSGNNDVSIQIENKVLKIRNLSIDKKEFYNQFFNL